MIKPYKGGPAYPLLVENTNPEAVVVFGETVEADEHMQFTGASKRDYFAASAPVGFGVVLRVWGDPDVNLHDDTTRRAFMSVWAMLRGEYADAMLAEGGQGMNPPYPCTPMDPTDEQYWRSQQAPTRRNDE